MVPRAFRLVLPFALLPAAVLLALLPLAPPAGAHETQCWDADVDCLKACAEDVLANDPWWEVHGCEHALSPVRVGAGPCPPGWGGRIYYVQGEEIFACIFIGE